MTAIERSVCAGRLPSPRRVVYARPHGSDPVSAAIRYWNSHWWTKACLPGRAFSESLLWRADPAEIARSFANVDARWLAAARVVDSLAIFLKGIDLKIVFDALGVGRARVRETFSATSIGLMVNWLVPARLGEFARAYALQRSLRRRAIAVPVATIFGTVLGERLFAVASIVVILVAFVVFGVGVPGWALSTFWVAVPLVAGVLVALIVFEIVMKRRRRGRAATPPAPGAAHLERRGGSHAGGQDRRGLVAHLRAQAEALADSSRIMGKPGSALLEFAAQVATWLVQLVVYFLVLEAFHLGWAGIAAAGLVMVLTNIIGVVPITPGNWGTFQAAAVGALAVSGVGRNEALAYAIGIQGLQTVVGLTLGFFFLSREHLSLREIEDASLRAEEKLPELVEEAEEGPRAGAG